MPSAPNPIYDPRFLHAAKAHLKKGAQVSLAKTIARLSEFAATWQQPQLPTGLVADLLTMQQTGNPRAALRCVTPPLVLVDISDRGRLARLEIEWIEGDGCTGSLYPHQNMVGSMDDEGNVGGIFTDATWDGAITAALGHAEEHHFAIPKNADVRWRVELVNEDDAYSRQDVSSAETEPWKPAALLHGRSAGAAFLIGLVYLGQRAREGAAIDAEIRSKVITLLPLLVLPTLPERGPLQELGTCKRRLKSAAGGTEWCGGRKVRHLQINHGGCSLICSNGPRYAAEF